MELVLNLLFTIESIIISDNIDRPYSEDRQKNQQRERERKVTFLFEKGFQQLFILSEEDVEILQTKILKKSEKLTSRECTFGVDRTRSERSMKSVCVSSSYEHLSALK